MLLKKLSIGSWRFLWSGGQVPPNRGSQGCHLPMVLGLFSKRKQRKIHIKTVHGYSRGSGLEMLVVMRLSTADRPLHLSSPLASARAERRNSCCLVFGRRSCTRKNRCTPVLQSPDPQQYNPWDWQEKHRCVRCVLHACQMWAVLRCFMGQYT